MSTQGNVAVLVPGEARHAWQENEKNMVYFVNGESNNLASGAVVIRDTSGAEKFKLTTTLGDVRMLGVIPQIDDASGTAGTQTIAAGARGYVQTSGKIAAVNVDGTTNIGDYLIAATTGGSAHPVAAWRAGVFGVATSACVGAGSVSAVLFPVVGNLDHTTLGSIGSNAHTDIDAHLSASAQVHGLPASANALGNRTASGSYVQYGITGSISDGGSVTFPVAFGTACSCVVATVMASGGAVTVTVYNVSRTGFNIKKSAGTDALYWMAVGY